MSEIVKLSVDYIPASQCSEEGVRLMLDWILTVEDILMLGLPRGL
jgi:hypothetical protein